MGISAAKKKASEPRDETINIRATRSQKLLIDRAASATDRTRSEFMLESACLEAQDVLLDRRFLRLSEEEFDAFQRMLDEHPKANPRLKRLMARKPLWES